jgi:hypothetical protein
VTGWIQPAPVASRTEPRLVARADLGALNAYLTECGVGIDELDVAGAASIAEVIDRMIGVFPFPG